MIVNTKKPRALVVIYVEKLKSVLNKDQFWERTSTTGKSIDGFL